MHRHGEHDDTLRDTLCHHLSSYACCRSLVRAAHEEERIADLL